MGRVLSIAFIFGGLFLTQATVAQPVLNLTDTDQPVGECIAYYVDHHQYSPDDILDGLATDSFVVATEPVLNFGLSGVTYWLRLQIKNDHPSDESWFVELAYPLLDSVSFYRKLADGSWEETVSGELVKDRSQPVHYKHFLFPMVASDTTIHTYYLKITTESAARFPVFIRRADNFLADIITEEIIFGMFYGAMLMMVLYNLFLFFALRETGYLLYCAFILLNTAVQATFNGHIQLLGFALPYINTWLLICMFGAALFGVVFAMIFLQTKRLSGFLHRVLLGEAGVAGLFLLLSFGLPYRVNAVAASILFLIIPLTVWISGLVAWRKGNATARYFVAAWTLYLTAVTLISLRTLGVIPGSMPLEVVMQLGSVLDAVLLSLALADRITIYRQERVRAQARALAISQEKEQLVKEQNRRLEEQVARRTEEIQTQNEELQAQQEAIAELNEELLNQNKGLGNQVSRRTEELARSNRELVGQNQRLEQFASVISHNLRGPIASILGLGNVFERPNLNAFNQRCLAHLQQAAQRLDTVANDLNQLLTYSSGTLTKVEPVRLESVLQTVIEKLSDSITQEKAEVTGNFEKADCVFAVASWVELILTHLIANALKFKSYEVNPLIHVISSRTENHVVLAVSDNGLGIDIQKYQNKLFNLYQRFHTHREGRGVGLYLVKTQMEALGGNVTVESNLGEGTTFYLHFEDRLSIQKK